MIDLCDKHAWIATSPGPCPDCTIERLEAELAAAVARAEEAERQLSAECTTLAHKYCTAKECGCSCHKHPAVEPEAAKDG